MTSTTKFFILAIIAVTLCIFAGIVLRVSDDMFAFLIGLDCFCILCAKECVHNDEMREIKKLDDVDESSDNNPK